MKYLYLPASIFCFFRANAEDDPRTLQKVDAGKYR